MTEKPVRFGPVVCLTGLTVLWLLSVGCTPASLPTGPSELTTGITIYLNANFQGDSAHVTGDISNLASVRGGPSSCNRQNEGESNEYSSWDDCVSSLRIAPGWRATLYEHPDFKGASLDVTEDAPNLQLVQGPCRRNDWNDCTSSIRVRMR